ncbi:diacylglycerol/lipid kinase family protein [Patescibacteria group bacterium]
MYSYIYDSFLIDKKYQNALFRIEARLLELGINGRIEKLTILKSMKELVADAVSRKSETIVLVGNDETLTKAISFLTSHKITLGLIPIGPDNSIADMLGIPNGEKACDILSRRIIERIDLGKANGTYFLSRLEVPSMANVTLECNGYVVSATQNSAAKICNLSMSGRGRSNPQDGIMEAIIEPEDKKSIGSMFQKKYSRESVFPIKKAFIRGSQKNVSVLADGKSTIKTPVQIEIAPKELSIIVGRNRSFRKK